VIEALALAPIFFFSQSRSTNSRAPVWQERKKMSAPPRIDPKNFTREQLLELVRERKVNSAADYALLTRMNKSELALILNTVSSAVAAASSSSVAPPPPSKSARTLCESDLPGTTIELRRLAVQRNVAHASTLTKKQLCVALAAVENESYVQDEEMELPAGFLDMVTQEVMRDPIVASDGYSYGYNSLRLMFLAAARRFVDQGRPAGRPRHVASLNDPSLDLQNPFPDVPEWPASFPLIRNHDLRRAIDEWLTQHGLSNEKDGVEDAQEPVYSRRDEAGFENGIFYGEDAAMAEEEEKEDAAEEMQDARRDSAKNSLLELGTYASLKSMDDLRTLHARDLSQNGLDYSSVLYAALGIVGQVFGRNVVMGLDRGVLGEFRLELDDVDPALRFNALVHMIRNAGLMKLGENTASVTLRQVADSMAASSLPSLVSVDVSFSSLARSQDGFVSAQTMVDWARRELRTPHEQRHIDAMNQYMWQRLRQIDSGHVVRRSIRDAPEEYLENLESLLRLNDLDIFTYSQTRREIIDLYFTQSRTLEVLQGVWDNENDGEGKRRAIIRMMVDLFASNIPREQRIVKYKWIPTYGAVVGIRDEALDLLGNHAWTGFTQARDIVADLVAYVVSTKFYIIDTREVRRALELRQI